IGRGSCSGNRGGRVAREGRNGKRVRDNVLFQAVFNPGARFRQTELYRSVVRHPPLDTPRGRAMTSFHNFFLHIYPVKVPRKALSWRSTLRLGFIAAVLFLILYISGMYLMFFYHPAVPEAYFDMHNLSTGVAFGQFVRNIHRWSAHVMVLVVFLHLLLGVHIWRVRKDGFAVADRAQPEERSRLPEDGAAPDGQRDSEDEVTADAR